MTNLLEKYFGGLDHNDFMVSNNKSTWFSTNGAILADPMHVTLLDGIQYIYYVHLIDAKPIYFKKDHPEEWSTLDVEPYFSKFLPTYESLVKIIKGLEPNGHWFPYINSEDDHHTVGYFARPNGVIFENKMDKMLVQSYFTSGGLDDLLPDFGDKDAD